MKTSNRLWKGLACGGLSLALLGGAGLPVSALAANNGSSEKSNDVKEQMLVALDKIRTGLEEAGSSMEHVVKTTIMLKRLEDYAVMRATEREYYEKYAPGLVEEPPASTFLQPASLARPDMLVEIDVVACLKD